MGKCRCRARVDIAHALSSAAPRRAIPGYGTRSIIRASGLFALLLTMLYSLSLSWSFHMLFYLD